jgi:glycosyltransferase involved in cell wall biosynthesis
VSQSPSSSVPALSVVVPCHNEEGVLDQLLRALSGCLDDLVTSYEVVLVDDGSRDGTLALMRAAALADPRVRYLSFSRNFGKEAAMFAGLSEARGQAVAFLDADLQHPPELLAQMLPQLEQGYDQVVARRTRTGDKPLRTVFSRLYYRVINHLIDDVKLENGIGDFRVLSRRAADALLALGERNRFSKGLFSWIGFETAVVDYENVARAAGETKWGFGALVNYGIDGVISFNSKPLRMAIHLGLLASLLGFVYAIEVVVQAIVTGVNAPGYTTLMCTVLVFGGLQLIVLGVVGEYMGRIFVEVKARPIYLVKESEQDLAPHDLG